MSLDPDFAKDVSMDEKAKQALLKDMQHFLINRIYNGNTRAAQEDQLIQNSLRGEITVNC